MKTPTKPSATNDRGIALAVSLLLMLVLTVAGIGMVTGGITAQTVGRSFQSQQRAFQSTEAGLEYGREELRTRLNSGSTMSDVLEAAANGGTLVDPSSLVHFLGSTGLVNETTNSPFIASTSLGHGAFQVFVTNDSADGTTSTTDTNEQVLLTAFGSGAGGKGFAVAQSLVRIALADLPKVPGVIVLPGPDVNYQGLSSNSQQLDGENTGPEGGCYATVAVTSATALATITDDMVGPPDNTDRYRTCDPVLGTELVGVAAIENAIYNDPNEPQNPYEPLVPNVPALATGDPRIMRVDYMSSLASRIKKVAHFTSPTDPGFTLGTPTDPKVVAIDGNYTVGSNQSGAGILLVTGNLNFSGNINYEGLVLAIGKGSVTIEGGGTGSVDGSILVANVNSPWDEDSHYVGIPTYIDNGGGTADQTYVRDLSSGDRARRSLPLERIAYQQLR